MFQVLLQYACVVLVETKYPFGYVFAFLSFLFFFFFFPAACFDFSTVNSASVHCSRIPKLHFSATFSLKMSLTVLFTHLKIILLQYFQFSVSV